MPGTGFVFSPPDHDTMDTPTERRRGPWHLLTRPSARWSLGGLLLTGLVGGIILWGGFNTAVELTNREGFCIGCHEMRDNVYAEYRDTVHYSNRTGVRAVCADCHVPREWGPKIVRKIRATHELWGKITGTIDTPEKFEARRLELARREWRRMLANDSLECRNCHGLESMDPARQATRSARAHERARTDGITCIACHQGIAHRLPGDMTGADDLRPFARPAVPAGSPAVAGTKAPAEPPATPDAPAPAPAVPDTPPPASAPSATASAIDWDGVEPTEIVLFYPGVAHMDWVRGEERIGRDRHGGGWAFNNGETCYACHFDETPRMGQRIVSGTKLEPTPIPGKAATIPVAVQAAHDGERLYLRFRWTEPPAPGGTPMDADNAVKLAFMLDAGRVEGAERNGCWSACHRDARGMPEGDPQRTKHVPGGSLADGVFYDLVQWRSGDGRATDGHVGGARVMEGGRALVEARGGRDGDTWTVTFVRRFAGGDGDVTLAPGGVYNFGFAIHDGHAAGRFHHVSLGYTLGIDADALITARRR